MRYTHETDHFALSGLYLISEKFGGRDMSALCRQISTATTVRMGVYYYVEACQY
jgi:hypothetical protein